MRIKCEALVLLLLFLNGCDNSYKRYSGIYEVKENDDYYKCYEITSLDLTDDKLWIMKFNYISYENPAWDSWGGEFPTALKYNRDNPIKGYWEYKKSNVVLFTDKKLEKINLFKSSPHTDFTDQTTFTLIPQFNGDLIYANKSYLFINKNIKSIDVPLHLRTRYIKIR